MTAQVVIRGSVYGGGNLADVKENTVVNMGGGTVEKSLYGGGKGKADEFECKKAMVGIVNTGIDGANNPLDGGTTVNITNGTVVGDVYGGGEVGRVERNTIVTIGEEGNASLTPIVKGHVFGAGKGLATHGYSALVRGNSTLTIQGKAQVWQNVHGGGENSSVGRFKVKTPANENDPDVPDELPYGMPARLIAGGKCTVTIKDDVIIGKADIDGSGYIYGAGQGVTPSYNNDENDENRSKRMVLYTSAEAHPNNKVDTEWNYYVDEDGNEDRTYVWEYFTTEADYLAFLKTLALTSHTDLEIGGSAHVYGSVFGGGERGITLGNVEVTMSGGTVDKDVYGGGALADTNQSNETAEKYDVATVTVGETDVTGMYERSGESYELTEDTKAEEGKTYYTRAAQSSINTTTVDLLGGYIKGDAYGGGLGQKAGFNSATSNIEATVWGDIDVTLDGTKFDINYDTDNESNSVVKSGRVFGCNNLLGSPQGDVTVTVNQTVAGNTSRTSGTVTETVNGVPTVIEKRKSQDPNNHSYELAAVYGGGNLAPYTTTGKKAHVIINGCDLTSILTVYGGGNAAPVPETDVDVNGTYEIGSVFGGGNGKDKYKNDAGWQTNPGANVGTTENPGNTNTMIYGGTVHEAYGASNEKGTVYGSVTIDIADSGLSSSDPGYCPLDVAQLVGAGKNADVNGDLKLIMGCKPDTKIPIVYGGADNANVNGDVELTITSGNFGKVVGGNNNGGCIKGHIILNIEETTCIPINIDHLYLCGYNAAYSQYGYYVKTTETEAGTGYGDSGEHAILTSAGKLDLIPRESADDPHKPVDTYSYTYNETTEEAGATWTVHPSTFAGYASPVLNVISCTSIGEVFGGGYGAGATVYGDPTVNINMIPGAHADEIDRDGDGNADGETDALGAIGDVYGGGDAAAVYGNTTVNIGTATTTSVYQFDVVNGEYKVQYEEDRVTPIEVTQTVTGAYITGNVYGGGKLADVGKYHTVIEDNKDRFVIDVPGNTNVNIGAKYNTTTGEWESVTEGTGVLIVGDVYGGGKGSDATYTCEKAMVLGGTNVRIGNGTVQCVVRDDGTETGNVYGGGEVARLEQNTEVTIGFGSGSPTAPTSTPIIEGYVFGAGAGVRTHGYSALVRGNSTVTIEGNAKVKKCVYGGGEKATVGKYTVGTDGLPTQPVSGGTCTVTVGGYAEIGPNDMKMYHHGVAADVDKPDDYGHVFGAGKGVLPYEGCGDAEQPHHNNATKHLVNGVWDGTWVDASTDYPAYNPNQALSNDYINFFKTLACATKTNVTIKGHAFVKGSVYGGSENGYVQRDTYVTIQGDCQIGNGFVQMKDDGTYLATSSMRGVNRRYTDAEWSAGHLITTNDDEVFQTLVSTNCPESLPECASWQYGETITVTSGESTTNKAIYAPYDPFAGTVSGNEEKYDKDTGRTTGRSTEGGRRKGSDGHTFFGNVFGGGSGYYPYKPGRWFEEAGSVYGNTYVTINGGHILTSVYGGNEMTDVGKYDGNDRLNLTSGGSCYVTMIRGTLGVPRTLKQIEKHPVTCYLFGAGKGDQRVFFNKSTNVGNVFVHISDDARIYGSVFGGGEDGHVMKNVEMNIGGNTLPAVYSSSSTDEVLKALNLTAQGTKPVETSEGTITHPYIGNWGTSYVDGNVFGGGRGFGGDAYTAGNVAGTVTMNIYGGTMLGSIYGGGRLGSVGYGLFDASVTANYGKMQDDYTREKYDGTLEENVSGFMRGYVYMTIGKDDGTGPTIGNTWEYVNVPTEITESGLAAWKTTNHVPNTEYETTTETITNEGNSTTLYHHRLKHTKGGNVFAGGMGRLYQLDGISPISAVDWWKLGNVKSTTLTIKGGTIKSNVYGGGELGMVQGGTHTSADNKTVSTEIAISGGTIGTVIQESVTVPGANEGDPPTTELQPRYTFGSVFGGGYGSLTEELNHTGSTNPTYTNASYYRTYPKYIAGRVKGSTEVTMTGGEVMASVYGGGEMAAVGESTVLANPGDDDPKVLGETLTGNSEAPVEANTYVTIGGGTIGKEKVGMTYFGGATMGNVYGGGSGDNNTVRSGHIYGNTNVTISGESTRIYHNVYGGGAYGTVGDFDYNTKEEQVTVNNETVTVKKVSGIKELKTSGTGVATVTITDGTIGIDGKENGIVFGSSRGDINKPEERDDYTAWVYNANVTIGTAGTPASGTEGEDGYVPAIAASGPEIKGSVYGSGENGHTFNNTVVTVNGGTIGIDDENDDGFTVASNGTTYEGAAYPYRGNVYGGGCGTDKYYSNHALETHDGNGQLFNPLAGIVYGTTTVNINGGTVVRNVYGAGAMGSVGKATTTEGVTTITGGTTSINVSDGTIGVSGTVGDGNVFGAARGDVNATITESALVRKSTSVSVTGGTIKDNVYGGGELGCVGTFTEVTIDGNATVNGSVFGGGELGLTKGSVIVNIKGGTIAEDVYGGGSLANSNTTNTADLNNDGVLEPVDPTTTVNLMGGTINRNVYGGGLGRLAGTNVSAVEAKVFGDVLVKLNEPTDPEDDDTCGDCVVKGTIFGCNNLNGSPQKGVTVHIYKTESYDDDHTKDPTKSNSKFDLKAVYGGGNLAAYYPDDETARSSAIANVIIDGCELTSIETVYGGGNAASVPATEVTVNGTYEIGELFGGGNGKDVVSYDGGDTYKANPGANVGYRNYSTWNAQDEVVNVSGADTKEGRAPYAYGSGIAHAIIYGGTVHAVYGGSNTKGNVRVESIAELDGETNPLCEFDVEEAYGGGRNADQDGAATLKMKCIRRMGTVYGGAENADVESVNLNITNGTYDRVFGGNNKGGRVNGSITVNIEETGCRPIIIGELYGGGNMAGYSVYGYKEVNGKWAPRERADDAGTGPTTPYSDPQVNVRSFTSIGNIYGGGYGSTATMVADPTVNINVVMSDRATGGNGDDTEVATEGSITITDEDDNGNTTTHTVNYPTHEKGKIGAIYNVFGGGNAAKVVGSTYVNIGTTEYEYLTVSIPVGTPLGSGSYSEIYTRTGNTYTHVTSGAAASGTTYYKKYTVVGADIRGNVYGGGNAADVSGNTNVVIGKENED